jgi:hypothetical protein
MGTRAKFVCTQVDKTYADQNHVQVFLRAVYAGDDNKEWSKYTPAGELQMTITNPNLIGFFEADKEYFLDITPAKES